MPENTRENQLINARRACLTLAPYATGTVNTAILRDEARELFADLLEQFGRLDAAERKRAKGGEKGGRPATGTSRTSKWRKKKREGKAE